MTEVTQEGLVSAAMAEYSAGNAEAAVGLLQSAVTKFPSAALCHYHLGTIYWSQSRMDDAVACFERARDLDPAVAEVPYQKGIECARDGELGDAESWLGLALAFRPDHALAMLCLGDVLRRQGRVEDALPLLKKAVALVPEYWKAYSDLALALCDADRLLEAASALETASRLHLPDMTGRDATVACNLGAVRRFQGRPHDAIRLLTESTRLAPDFAEAHLNLAFALLVAGRFEEGWHEFEWRPKIALSPHRPLEAHLQAGLSLEGKTVLLHEEQGLGDLIQFVRYAIPLEQMGARVVIACNEAVHPLIRSARGVADVVPSDDSLSLFDLNTHLLSLPRIFQAIPLQVPYLHADPERVAAWEERLASEKRLRVGLVWGGNPGNSYDRRRSIPLARLTPLLRNPEVAFYALQRGPRMEELDQLDPGLTVVNLEEECDGIMDTAAAIMGLDLVISADTMPAHLAGALGKPVWLLLPFAPDWRWMLARQDSAWYSGMRLFRQRRPGDWDGVVEQVAKALSSTRLAADQGG
jgi:tetratricopeptide (TPR) repeat protein